MGTKHDLKEMKFAKDVMRDFPFIKAELDSLQKKLKDKRHYLCVAHVLAAIEDSQEMIVRQYGHYKMVYTKKGEDS